MSRPIDILLVEDNPGDVRLIEVAFREGKIANRIHVAKDGVEALAFLRRETPHEDSPRPDLILLDLNLPRKGGREVLAEIKEDPELKRIPVAVMTTSDAEQDIVGSYDLHANCYVKKPIDAQEFLRAVGLIQDFWLTIVKLPTRIAEGQGP